ncbi:MAG TPA: phosphatidylglycerophosphatase A [Gammaproteobacteria bacterium]
MRAKNIPASVWRNPIHFIAFGFGVGTIRIASGTFGTLAAIPIYLLLQDLTLIFYVTCVAALFLLGVWICDVTSRDLGVDDHPGIVIDEIAGFLVTMTAAPAGWLWLLCGFILFRLFDIWKPWPIRIIDKKLSGGIGIMLDDIVAGILALLILQIIALYIIE